MKIRIMDRILVALAGLLMLAGCALAAAQLFFGKNVLGRISGMLENNTTRVYLIIGLALLFILGIYCVLVLFRHKSRKDKFIMQKTENGELAISLKAMESMVQKCLDPHKELNTQGVKLENQKGGLLIRIRGTVAGGVSIPLTVDALQQQIRQYVTACSGIEVKDIRVQIESSGPDAKDAPFAIEAPAGKPLLSEGRETEKAQKPAKEESPVITPEELEKVLAETPAPVPPETVESAEPIVVPPAAAAAAEMLMNEAPQEEDDRPIHQRLFSNQDRPCVMPMPPEDTEEKKTEETEEKPAEEPEDKPEEKPEEQPADKTEEKPEDKPAEGKTEDAGKPETAEGSED